MKKYPFVKQHDEKDCGVACLSMIIQYYHGYADMERIRVMTKTTKDGTTAYHMIEAAQSFGFTAYGIKTKLNKNASIITPFIAHVKLDNGYYHYVVIYKISYHRETLLIADPGRGIYTCSFTDFLKQWTNIAIILYPKSAIEVLDSKSSLLTFSIMVTKKYLSSIFSLCVFSLIIGILSLFTSFLTKWMFDSVVNKIPPGYFYVLSILGIVLFLLKHMTNYIRVRLFTLIDQKIQLFLMSNLFERLLFLPYQYYYHRTTGELLSRINDIVFLREFLGKIYLFFSFDCFMFIISFLILGILNEELCALELLIIGFFLLFWLITYRFYEKYSYQIQSKKASLKSSMNDILSGLKSIQGIHVEKQMHQFFLTKILDSLKSERRYQLFSGKHQFCQSFISDVGFLLQILVGCILILQDQFTIGNLLLFELLSGYIMSGFEKFTELYVSYGQAKNAYDRIAYLLKEQDQQPLLEYKINGCIQIKNLSYSYREDKLLLDNVDLLIEKGEKVLLLGNSGSGKSTLLQLLMKYYNLERDMILYDNIDICDIRKEDIKRAVTYVNQNGMLLSDTLYHNIVLNRSVTQKELKEAIDLCHLDSVIKNNKLGLYMLLEENGGNLSGGERQRIMLARALLNSFEILLLDEATNQLDEQLEYKILRLLFWKYFDKTIIVVSHRRKNIELYDKVIELRNGKLSVV